MKTSTRSSLAVFCSVAGLALAASMSNAAIIIYSTTMSGPNEAPPNASPGIGTGTLTFDTTANTMRIQATFSGLLGNTTACHIHAATAVPGVGTAGVATRLPSFIGFPLGVTSGSMDDTYNMGLSGSWSAAYITNNGGTPASAAAAFMNAVAGGRAYLNVHSSVFGGGEIRGFWQLLPTPGVLPLAGIAGLVVARRRR